MKRVEATQVFLTARYVRASDTPDTHVLEYDEHLDLDPDGLSGGTVFHLGRNERGFFVGFAGVVMKGSGLLRQLQFLGPVISLRMLAEYVIDELASGNETPISGTLV